MAMVEMTVMIPGLETFGLNIDGTLSCTTLIPDLLISETNEQIAHLAYPYLAHCWLLNENISDASVEACIWECLDGTADERTITSMSNTLLHFWRQYKVCLLNHFKAVAPPKEFRDVVNVRTDVRFPRYAVWMVDSALLSTAPYGTFDVNQSVPTEISKYF